MNDKSCTSGRHMGILEDKKLSYQSKQNQTSGFQTQNDATFISIMEFYQKRGIKLFSGCVEAVVGQEHCK